MTQKLIGLLGVSGVGKSTLLREVAKHLKFQSLQASGLIKDGRQLAEATAVSQDHLRTVDIDENQQFLTTGYLKAVDPAARVVILDGHSVIDTPSGLVEISPLVFAKLGIRKIIFLADDPSEIMRRRNGDGSRSRPERSAAELAAYQDAAILQAVKIGRELDVPLTVVPPSQIDFIVQALTSSS